MINLIKNKVVGIFLTEYFKIEYYPKVQLKRSRYVFLYTIFTKAPTNMLYYLITKYKLQTLWE